MAWIIWLAIALGCAALGRCLKPGDEGWALALVCVGLGTVCWGLAIAPIWVQIALGLQAWLWVKARSPQG